MFRDVNWTKTPTLKKTVIGVPSTFPEEVNPGYYDFVFIYNNKVFATMLTKFYKTNELLDKPDSELEKLMKDWGQVTKVEQ